MAVSPTTEMPIYSAGIVTGPAGGSHASYVEVNNDLTSKRLTENCDLCVFFLFLLGNTIVKPSMGDMRNSNDLVGIFFYGIYPATGS